MVVVVDNMGRVERVVTPALVDSLDGRAIPMLEESEYRTNPFAITTAALAGSLITLAVITFAGYRIAIK